MIDIRNSLLVYKATGSSYGSQHTVTYRLKELAELHLVPGIKVKIHDAKGSFTTIEKVILQDLYEKGITPDQCPSLRQLADYMGAEYYKNHGKMVIKTDLNALYAYFEDGDGYE